MIFGLSSNGRLRELVAERDYHLKALENIEAAIRHQRERMG